MKFNKLIFLCVGFMIAFCCNENDRIKKNVISSPYKDTLINNLRTSKDSDFGKRATSQEIATHSPSMKGFNDIYFGTMDESEGFGQIETISTYKFRVTNKRFDPTYGLWSFVLSGYRTKNNEELNSELSEIFSILDKTYKNFRQINQSCNNCIVSDGDAKLVCFAADGKGIQHPPLNSDDGLTNFVRVYESEYNIIKIGYQLSYNAVYGQKMVTVLDNGDSYQIPQQNKNDIESFSNYYIVVLQFFNKDLNNKIIVRNLEAKQILIDSDMKKF